MDEFEYIKVGIKFFDTREGGGKFEITHITGNKLTVLITKKPEEGVLSVANPKWKLSENEFVMTDERFLRHQVLGNIKTD